MAEATRWVTEGVSDAAGKRFEKERNGGERRGRRSALSCLDISTSVFLVPGFVPVKEEKKKKKNDRKQRGGEEERRKIEDVGEGGGRKKGGREKTEEERKGGRHG